MSRQMGFLRRESLACSLAVGLALLALLIRLHGINHESLWLDEGYTLLFSHLSPAQIIHVGGDHEQPPFYYLLVHAVLQLHDSYLVPRVIAAVAGAGATFALYLLGARVFSPPAGLIAALLLAISPMHLWYSQDGRAYELVSLLILLSYLFLFMWLQHPRWRTLLAYAFVTILVLYTHYTAVFVLLPQALVLLSREADGVRRPLVTTWIGIAVAYVPWIGVLATNARTVAGGYWIAPPTWSDVVITILEFLGLRTSCPTGITCVAHGLQASWLMGHEAAVVTVSLAVLLLALAYTLRASSLRTLIVLLWFIVPFAALLLVSMVRPLFLDRYVLGATFPLYLLIGAGVAHLWHGRKVVGIAVGVLGLLVVTNLFEVGATYAGQSNPDWKSPSRDLQSAYRTGQVVAYYPGVIHTMVSQYLPRGWHATDESSIWLHTYLDVPGWQKRYGTLTDYQLRDRQFSHLTRGRDQVWIVMEDYAGIWDVWHWFTIHHFHMLLDERYSGGTYLQLWDRNSSQSFGPAVLTENGFHGGWIARGNVSVANGIARENGSATLTKVFGVKPGTAYTVDTEHRTAALPEPQIAVHVYRSCGQAGRTPRHLMGSYPQLQHFDLWANGSWSEKPFGFVAPPDARCAVLQLRTVGGTTAWRNVSVHRERTEEVSLSGSPGRNRSLPPEAA